MIKGSFACDGIRFEIERVTAMTNCHPYDARRPAHPLPRTLTHLKFL
jgi:hypothetical protein